MRNRLELPGTGEAVRASELRQVRGQRPGDFDDLFELTDLDGE